MAGNAEADNTAPAHPARRRRSVTPWRVGAWTAELLSLPDGLAGAYGPGRSPLRARTREQLIVAVAEVNGAHTSAWVHGSWLDFVGAREPGEALAPLFDYARACAEAGVPVDPAPLAADFPPAVVRSVRAAVAVGQLASFIDGATQDLIDRVQNQPRGSALAAVQDSIVVAVSLPLVAPTLVVAGTMKALTRLAPPLPRLDLPPQGEANLVVHLLAEAAPTYLGNALVRTSLVWSPFSLAIAFRMEGVTATIRVGRGRVEILNGVSPDALAVIDGGIETLLQVVAGSILRDLSVPVRRHST